MSARNLSRPNIESERPGYPPEYYHLFKHLDELVAAVVQLHGRDARDMRLMGGDSSAVISLTSGDEKLILKISPWGDLHNELFFYRTLAQHEIPAPRIVESDLTRSRVPYMYAFEEFVQGRGIGQLPAALRREAAAMVGETVATIDEIPVDGFGSMTEDGIWSHADGWESLGDTYLRTEIARHAPKILDSGEIDAVERVLDRDELRFEEPRLAHGDVAGSNFLFSCEEDGVRLRAVIDPDVVGGDPMADVAMAPNDFDEFARGFMDRYASVHRLTDVEMRRMKLLQVLTLYWSVCWHEAVGWDPRQPRRHLRLLLERLDLG
jgi:aminoglycoside phosphotransferase (APT) family kinase protein